MRNLEVIETELTAAREALSEVKGSPAEVYSRIVGYYRSVRNWNRGKREEYGERKMYHPDPSLLSTCMTKTMESDASAAFSGTQSGSSCGSTEFGADGRILLFVRPACPACPPAKAAASRLGIPMELYDADTDEGLAEAVRHQVLSTPTAILVSSNGQELGRARDAQTIEKLLELTA